MIVRSMVTAGFVLVSSAAPVAADQVVKVAHGPITATVIPVTAGKASAGDLRTYHIKLTKPKKSKRIGFMTGSLLTTAVNKPARGQEQRTADLVFTIGKAANQLVVGGVAAYEQQAPTFRKRTSVIRPVLGGSGKYAGARGWCESIHRKDNTWRHVFHLMD